MPSIFRYELLVLAIRLTIHIIHEEIFTSIYTYYIYFIYFKILLC